MSDKKIVLKVLFIAAAFPPRRMGEADAAFHISEQLAGRGHRVEVVTTVGQQVPLPAGITVHRIMQRWNWWALPRLARFLRGSKPDAVLLMFLGCMYGDHPMMTFLPTISKSLLPGVPFVTEFPGTDGARPNAYPLWDRIVRKLVSRWAGPQDTDYHLGTLLRDSDRVVVLSPQHQADLAKLYPAVNAKATLIPRAPCMCVCNDTRREARDRLGLPQDEFLIACFGRIYTGKGIETLLEAFAKLSARRNHVRLAIVGGASGETFALRPRYAQEMIELAAKLGLEKTVLWSGEYAWNSDQGSRYLRAADLCVLPMDWGVKLNNSSYTASAFHGLPIIATQAEVLEPPLRHEENVFVCPAQNPDAMAVAIETVLDNDALRQRLAAGALQLGQEMFSWKVSTDRLLTTFEMRN